MDELTAIVETITTEIDTLGRLWMDYGKQAGGFNPESGALYGRIQFTRTKVLDYVAMLAAGRDAERYRKLSAAPMITDERIWEMWREANNVHTVEVDMAFARMIEEEAVGLEREQAAPYIAHLERRCAELAARLDLAGLYSPTPAELAAAEREACAAVCEARAEAYRSTKAPGWFEVDHECTQCAAAIRARSEL